MSVPWIHETVYATCVQYEDRNMTARLLVSAREVCQPLGGMSYRPLWNLTYPRGPIPCIGLGRRVLYRLTHVLEFLDKLVQDQNYENERPAWQNDEHTLPFAGS